jgi:hypothetical protein
MSRNNITTNFKSNVRDWVAYDHKIIKAKNAIKRVKDKQEQLGEGIIKFMSENSLKDKEIKIQNYRLKYKTSKKTTPLTKGFILQSLTEDLQDANEAKEIVKILYNVRKRMEICLTNYFDDEKKATDLIDSIYAKREKTEVPVLRRRVDREEFTINNGPISTIAENTIRNADRTDESDA